MAKEYIWCGKRHNFRELYSRTSLIWTSLLQAPPSTGQAKRNFLKDFFYKFYPILKFFYTIVYVLYYSTALYVLHYSTVPCVVYYSLIAIIVITLHFICIVGISKIRTFLSYGYCPVPWYLVKGGSTAQQLMEYVL